jgi:hypothetical protein
MPTNNGIVAAKIVAIMAVATVNSTRVVPGGAAL